MQIQTPKTEKKLILKNFASKKSRYSVSNFVVPNKFSYHLFYLLVDGLNLEKFSREQGQKSGMNIYMNIINLLYTTFCIRLHTGAFPHVVQY